MPRPIPLREGTCKHKFYFLDFLALDAVIVAMNDWADAEGVDANQLSRWALEPAGGDSEVPRVTARAIRISRIATPRAKVEKASCVCESKFADVSLDVEYAKRRKNTVEKLNKCTHLLETQSRNVPTKAISG